jgi:hypothetical protein
VATQEATKTDQVTTKSGKGLSDGVISELATFWEVKPGHEEELRAATERLANTLKNAPLALNVRTGLRDERHVIFDGGKRLLWCTTFETDWEPYVDDAILSIGIDNFTDWVQHLTAVDDWQAWIQEAGGREKLNTVQDDDQRKAMHPRLAGLRKFLQDRQIPATGYFNALSDLTHPEIRKAMALYQAFQQVLDDPAGAAALQAAPALKPLLDQAAF